MPFAIKKGRFKLSTPVKRTSHVKLSKGGQSTKKIQNVLRPWNQMLAYKTMLWMSVVRTLAWCFHILEMSSIHTGEHTKQQRFKSKRRKIVNGKDCVTFHRTTAYRCCHSFFRWKLRGVFILSWVILDQRFLESTTPDRWWLKTFRQDSCCSVSGFSRCVIRIFLKVRPTFSTSSSPPPPTPNLNIFLRCLH